MKRPYRHQWNDHLPYIETGPNTARRPHEGEECQICGQATTYQSTGTVAIGMFVVDLDERTLWSEGRRLPVARWTCNWPVDELLVCTGPTPYHWPELFAYFPLENGAWGSLHVHHDEPELELIADAITHVHVQRGPNGPVAGPGRCEGVAGSCFCLSSMVTKIVIDTDDITTTLASWSSLVIPGLEEAKAHARFLLEQHGEEYR